MALLRRNFLFGIASLPAGSLLAGRPLPGLTATVYNGYELHTALQAAGPGSTIMLAPGNFGDIGSFVLAGNHVSVRVQAAQRTVLRSRMIVQGSFVDLDGLALEEGIHLAGDGLRIANSNFSGRGVDVDGASVEVTGCDIGFFRGRGITVKGTATNPHIHRNYIHDSRGGGGEAEAIQIGQSMNDTNRRVSALIEDNRLERVQSESEAISVKSSYNIIRNNTLRDSRAYIVNRHGNNNLYQGNTVENAYGIVIQDHDNRVIGNRCVNSILRRSIRIMGGNTEAGSGRQGRHPQARDTLVSGNTADYLIIGDTFPGHRLPAIRTTVVNHQGPVLVRNATGTSLGGADVIGEDDMRRGGNRRRGNDGGNGNGNGNGRRGGRDDDDRDGRGNRRRRRRNRRNRGGRNETTAA